ncbi:MAG TPA: glycosyltransferase, partial [Micromonosporaceae bacterium]
QQIIYLGVINPQDRVDLAVLAAERLAELRGRDGWELVVAGDGECLDDLRQLVDERGLQDIVRFTGWLDAAQVDSVLAAASIAIQPDPPTDMAHLSTMAKTIEYLARGLPVVAVDLIETRRSAEDAAVYVPNGTPDEFAKALDGLLGDASARARMREIGLERFSTVLAWEHQAAAYITTWQSLVPVPPGLTDTVELPRQRVRQKSDAKSGRHQVKS